MCTHTHTAASYLQQPHVDCEVSGQQFISDESLETTEESITQNIDEETKRGRERERKSESERECVSSSVHEHGAADHDEKVEPVLVWEQRVPDSDDVWQEELLWQQQGEPAEGEVLRLDVLLLLWQQKNQTLIGHCYLLRCEM